MKYASEDLNITPEDKQSVAEAFLNEQRLELDPPQYEYAALQAILETVKENDLFNTSPHRPWANILALIDDRRDTTGWYDIAGEHRPARDWEGYAAYPPKGTDVQWGLYDPYNLYLKLIAKVS